MANRANKKEGKRKLMLPINCETKIILFVGIETNPL